MKTNAIFSQSFLVLILLGLIAFTVQGQNLRESRDMRDFNSVEASGVFTIYLSQGQGYSLVIEAPEEFLQDIETSVSRNTLRISYKGRSRNLGEMKAFISAPEFVKLSGSGATTWHSENTLNTKELSVQGSGASSFFLMVDVSELKSDFSGATNVNYSGFAASHRLGVSGASFVRAFDLQTEDSEVIVSGASTARVNASNSLIANASGTSNVFYQQRAVSQDFRTSGMSSIRMEDAETAQSDEPQVRVRVGEHDVRLSRQPRTKARRPFKGHWGGFELGVNGWLTDDGGLEMPQEYGFLDLRYERSIVVNLNLYQQDFALISNNVGLVTGVGLSWNNYRFDRDVIPIRTPEGIDVAEPNPNYNYRRSKMTGWYLNVPMLLEFQTGNRRGNQFHLAGGVISGLRLRTHTKQVYFINGTRNRDKTFDDFHMRPFKFDATARIGWGDINLFATYSLNSLFRDERGPEVYPFTVGIRVVGW